MDLSTLITVGSIAVGVISGALMALHAVAPHTETKIDDKAAELGDEYVLPFMVRVLEWLRTK